MEGMSVKQTHAEGTRERQAVTFPGPTAAALVLPVLVAMGGQEPNSSGKATFQCIFRSWVVARVNLVFYQAGLGQVSPSHCCMNRQPQRKSWHFLYSPHPTNIPGCRGLWLAPLTPQLERNTLPFTTSYSTDHARLLQPLRGSTWGA